LSARSRKEAQNAYLGPIRESLSCIASPADNYLVTSKSVVSQSGALVVVFGRKVISLAGTDLSFYFEQTFHPVEDESGYFKVRTDAYIYRVDRSVDGDGHEEVVSYHWHPQTTDAILFPHLHIHITSDPHVNRIHFPTGRMSLERLLLFMIRDYGVKPRREDWSFVLLKNLEDFERRRSWQS